MNQLELLQSISKYFARFSEQVKLFNSNNEFHINIHAENLLVKVLNIVYDLKLINLNQSKSGNYAAIDLLDDDPAKKIAFQITSTNTIEKVKDCIQKFFRNGIYKKVNSLNIYILTNKQNSYSKDSIQKKINEEIDILIKQKSIEKSAEIDFQFDPNVNILDKTDLYKKLNEDNDLDIIILLERVIRQQYGIIEEKEELTSYYRGLKDMFYDTVMDDEKGMTLDHIYTEPSFSILNSAFQNEDVRFINKPRQRFYDADPRYKIHEFIEDIINGENPLQLKKIFRLILILGYPGQGKSSFCKKIMNDYVLSNKIERKSLFYFPLRNIRQAREFIYDPLSTLYEEATNVTGQNLIKSEFNKSIIILDGLDELYMRENLKLEEIDKLCVELVRLIEKYPDLHIIVTSRYGYVDDERLNKENILITHLSPFSPGLQLEWLSKYHNFHPETWLSKGKLEALNSEYKYEHIRELIEQPLLLHMIASVKSEIDENTNRARIYSQLFNEIIDRKYAKEGQIEILKTISKDDLKELIREVAFAIFQSGNTFITKTELLKLPSTQLFLKKLPEINFRDSIKGVMISFYFRETQKSKKDDYDEDKSNYAIEFLHKSLSEFMTAEKIFHSIKEQFLDKRSSGKYYIDDYKNALNVLLEVFGKQKLSLEIRQHLKEIINNSIEECEKEELADRMCLFLHDFANTDFLIEYRVEQGKNPCDISLCCFYGFWCFISCLGLRKNYLNTPLAKSRVTQYLRYISNSSSYSLYELDFSCQDLSESDLDNTDFFNCTFRNVNFSKTNFEGGTFDFCKLINVNADESYFETASFDDCDLNNCSIRNAFFGDIFIDNSRIEKVDFSDSDIFKLRIQESRIIDNTTEETMMIECSFINSTIDEDSVNVLKKYVLDLDRQSYKIYSDEIDNSEYAENADETNVDEAPADYKRIIIEYKSPFSVTGQPFLNRRMLNM